MLPEVKKIKDLPIFTPTKWQTVLLRNYGLVTNAKLAEVLRTDEQTIITEANRLGIEKIAYNEKWLERGYITIVRNNWHLLPYSQLMQLIEMSEEVLDYNLREDDFLSVKLGYFKPYCEEVFYSPLTATEIERTEELARIVKENFIENYVSPFEFGYDKNLAFSAKDKNAQFEKIVYAYSAMYGDTFLNDGEIIPEALLKKLSQTGVNGIWFQGVLSKLSPYPFIKGIDNGYEKRRENLRKLIAKCAEYGIKVYLYFNEPRALEETEFSNEMVIFQGRKLGTKIALCTSQKDIQEYLYNAVKDFVSSVTGLGGIITITASENLTNCYSLPDNDCPICSKRSRPEVVAEVNNIIMRAIRDSGTGAKLLANLWGWAPYMGWSKEEVFKGISLLDKDIAVMCVSEFGTVIKDGKPFIVGEYSLSQVGPCEETKEYLGFAKKCGHKILSKVQINNSWELSSVPYIPVFDLIIEHMGNLKGLGVTGLMLSWTLGGYPSASFNLVNEIFSGEFSYDDWLKAQFGNEWETAKESVALFSNAFRNYPFSTNAIYYGAMQIGPTNLWYEKSTGLTATMVCYPYDDIESWRDTFTAEEYKQKLQLLTAEWYVGLEILKKKQGNEQYEELKRISNVVYLHMKSLLNQFSYNEIKETADKVRLKSFVEEEVCLTKALYSIAARDARIGYEASNHYYFTQNTFLEKIINLYQLKTF